ncbi:MAG: sigma-70 family RNA polymerase sigma factor [Corynebacterium sp.]|nr:sigma-70 family RNA polymerase sigma factor [Corynebacterium sp.]
MTTTPSAPSDATDLALIQRYRGGDNQAFAELITRYYDRIVGYSHVWTHNRADAEDLAQESILVMLGNAPKFTGRAQLSTWLYRVVATTAASHYRRSRKQQPQFIAGCLPLDPTTIDPFEALAGTLDLRSTLHTALRTLPREQRAAIFWVDLMGMREVEAAKRQRVQPGTVRSRRFRGLRDLRVQLESEHAAGLV